MLHWCIKNDRLGKVWIKLLGEECTFSTQRIGGFFFGIKIITSNSFILRIKLSLVLSNYSQFQFVLDFVNIYADTFLGFSVYISNTTNKEDGVLCFRDTNYTKATIPILSTSPVLTTGDTSSTTTTGPILHILMGILIMPGIPSVKLRFTVIHDQFISPVV